MTSCSDFKSNAHKKKSHIKASAAQRQNENEKTTSYANGNGLAAQ